MSAFKELALAAQRLDEVLKNAYVGMVPCSDIGQFDTLTEKWEIEICETLKEIKLLNSKSILVNATLKKDSVPEVDAGDLTVMSELCGGIGSAIRWRKMLKVIAMSKAANQLYEDRESSREECLILDELCGRLFKHQHALDLLEGAESRKRSELNQAKEEWRGCGEEYAVRSKVNYMDKRREEPISEDLNLLIRKVEIMQGISNRLLTSAHKYDWIQDPNNLMAVVQRLRRDRITADTFS